MSNTPYQNKICTFMCTCKILGYLLTVTSVCILELFVGEYE